MIYHVLTNFSVVHVNSHCTSTLVGCETLPQSLVASHMYCPASLLLFISFNTFVVTRWPSGLIHSTTGGGSPNTWHVRAILLPSVNVWFSIACMDGGTVSQEPISKHFLNQSNGPNHEGPIIYKKSNLNHGFTQSEGLRLSPQESWINEINVLPLLAFGPLDTVHKSRCSDGKCGYLEDIF